MTCSQASPTPSPPSMIPSMSDPPPSHLLRRLRLRAAALPLLAAIVLALILPACSGPRNFENENDRLRAENLDLTDRVASLTDRVAGLEEQVEIEQQRAGSDLPEGITRPAAVSVKIGGYSGGTDTDGDGDDDALRLYLTTHDARGRFIQTLAEVKVTAAALPPGEDARTVAAAEFDAETFDAAYRSGFTGTHYTLTVPVTDPAPPGTDHLTVRVAVKDVTTGRTHTAERSVPWSASSDDSSNAQPDE